MESNRIYQKTKDTEGKRMGVQAMKHAVMLQEWSTRIAECRSSGKTVKAWCAQQGIAIKTYYYWEKRCVEEATRQMSLPAPAQAGQLIRINPDSMPGGNPVVNGFLLQAMPYRHSSQVSITERHSTNDDKMISRYRGCARKISKDIMAVSA